MNDISKISFLLLSFYLKCVVGLLQKEFVLFPNQTKNIRSGEMHNNVYYLFAFGFVYIYILHILIMPQLCWYAFCEFSRSMRLGRPLARLSDAKRITHRKCATIYAFRCRQSFRTAPGLPFVIDKVEHSNAHRNTHILQILYMHANMYTYGYIRTH